MCPFTNALAAARVAAGPDDLRQERADVNFGMKPRARSPGVRPRANSNVTASSQPHAEIRQHVRHRG